MKLSLYIIIASRIQLFSRLRRFTSVERSLQINLFMQNEPNFRKSQMNVSYYITMEYENRTLGERGKNEPKRTQFILAQPLAKQDQSQFQRQKMLLMLHEVLAGRKQAAAGFEPANNGFANRRLRPLGYAAPFKITAHFTGNRLVLQ